MGLFSTMTRLAVSKADEADDLLKLRVPLTKSFRSNRINQAKVLRNTANTMKRVEPQIEKAMRIPNAVGRKVGRVGRFAGNVSGKIAERPGALVAGSIGLGIASGVASGVRGTGRMVNRDLGNPVGQYADMMTRTAFSGNPSNSRTKRGGASGNITLNNR